MHVTQVTGKIALLQISNANRQHFTSNNSNSTFRFRNTNSQKITNNDSNSTFSSAQLTDFPARTAEKTPKSFFKGVRTPKTSPTFGYLRLYTLARLVVTLHGIISCILHTSSPNRDIEKIIAFSAKFHFLPWSLKWSPRPYVEACPLMAFHTYPCKALFPNIRLTFLGSDFPCS
ncbi:hypothetical protein AVEN_127513-1 [Araneus ventricosus]|uniref:Uncharacterized protein n=1 Tax=Araneus ventricosus TaxID=182803 RepID=A0A4Y2IIW1_ARAVE|nr:hypothetical protein AVEN_127513-1 [Araneus ventricosus]